MKWLGRLRGGAEDSGSQSEPAADPRAREDAADLALELCVEAILLLDGRRRIVYANRGARETYGAEVGRSLISVILDHELDNLLRRSVAQGEQQRATVVLSHPHRVVQVAVLPTAGGTTVMALRDETRLYELERVRRDLVANISHELRTPLATLRMVIDTLIAGGDSDPGERSYFLDSLKDQTLQMSEIVEGSLELASLEAEEAERPTEEIGVDALISAAVNRIHTTADRRRVAIAVQIEPGLPGVAVDRRAMQSAVANLVDNAVKWSTEGTAVSVSAARVDEGVTIEIADSGPGIDPALLPRVFERFFVADPSRSGSGKGLGLAIAKHAVLREGGRIWASNKPGGGARFSIFLPAAPASGPRPSRR